MKNKKLTYALIPLVILIWGAIGYQLYNGVGSSVENNASDFTISTIEPIDLVEEDWQLDLNYTDPFLNNSVSWGRTYQALDREPTIITPKETASKPKEEPIIWPSIIYKGYVKNQVFVEINGQSQLMKEKDQYNGVALEGIFMDSIKMTFRKEVKFIQLKVED